MTRVPSSLVLGCGPAPDEGAAKEAGAALSWPGETEEAPLSRLVRGDNLAVLEALRSTLQGRVRLAYLDPPYATGATFRTRVPIGVEPEPASLRETALASAVAYGDRFPDGMRGWAEMMRPRLRAVADLLAPGGSLVLHGDVQVGPALKALADEVLGPGRFRNAIAWHYYNKLHDRRKRALPSAFDVLYWYALPPEDEVVYQPMEEPRPTPVRQLVRRKVGGRMVNARGPDGRLVYRERTTKGVDNVWRIPGVQPAARDEFVHFETQKPLRLLARIVELTTRPGELVLDPFLGSGTTAVAAARLGRRFIGIDERPLGVHLARKRLLSPLPIAPGTAEPGPRFAVEGLAPPDSLAPRGRVVLDGRRTLRWTDFRSPALEAAVAFPGGALASWEDALDYWAVDWAFDGEVFQDRWRAFRMRRARTLPLEAELPEGVDPARVRVVGIDPLGHPTPWLTPLPTALGPGTGPPGAGQ